MYQIVYNSWNKLHNVQFKYMNFFLYTRYSLVRVCYVVYIFIISVISLLWVCVNASVILRTVFLKLGILCNSVIASN